MSNINEYKDVRNRICKTLFFMPSNESDREMFLKLTQEQIDQLKEDIKYIIYDRPMGISNISPDEVLAVALELAKLDNRDDALFIYAHELMNDDSSLSAIDIPDVKEVVDWIMTEIFSRLESPFESKAEERGDYGDIRKMSDLYNTNGTTAFKKVIADIIKNSGDIIQVECDLYKRGITKYVVFNVPCEIKRIV